MRTTREKVEQIIDLDPVVDVTPFIIVANELVTEHCEGLTDARLAEIERWLAAHFYEVRDERPQSEAAGGASKSYVRTQAMFLHQTKYGQTAMMLDSTGKLNGLSERGGDTKDFPVITYLGDELS